MVHDFFIPIIKTFGNEHFQRFHDSHYHKLYLEYGKPHRAYHNRDHIVKVAMEAGFKAKAAWWLRCTKPKSPEVQKLVLASYYHDFYPDVKKSAKLGKRSVKEMGFPEEYSEFVYDAIMATKLHKTEDPTVQKLINADLKIFTTRRRAEYIKYMLKVRLEYPNVDDLTYAKERTKVLTYYKNEVYNGRMVSRPKKEDEDIGLAIKNIIFELNILFRFQGLSSAQSYYLKPRSLIATLSDLDDLVNVEYKGMILK